MRNWLASVLAHTSDLGTEVGFGDTKHDPEQLLASSFSPVSYSSGVANFSDECSDGDHEVADYDVMTCGVCGPGASQGFAYPMCVTVAGILHILHNATKDVTQRMEHFKTWYYPMLKGLCSLVSRKGWRNLIVAKCYSEGLRLSMHLQ